MKSSLIWKEDLLGIYYLSKLIKLMSSVIVFFTSNLEFVWIISSSELVKFILLRWVHLSWPYAVCKQLNTEQPGCFCSAEPTPYIGSVFVTSLGGFPWRSIHGSDKFTFTEPNKKLPILLAHGQGLVIIRKTLLTESFSLLELVKARRTNRLTKTQVILFLFANSVAPSWIFRIIEN